MPTEQSTTEPEAIEVGGVVLAAGTSSRFETGNKLLEVVNGEPLVRRVTKTACDSALDDVVVIVGHEADAVRDAVADLPVSVHQNEAYAEGQSASVRLGAQIAQRRDWDGAMFLLGDMPFVRSETLDSLLSSYAADDGSIIVPRYEDTRGNPVLFDSQHFETLADVSGDRGGRELIQSHPGTKFVETDDPGVLQDIDSETDLRRYTE